MALLNIESRTAVANTTAELLPASAREMFIVQNPFSEYIYIGKVNPVPMDSTSIIVPKASGLGPGEYQSNGEVPDQWFYRTAASGVFGVQYVG